jgi:hypothetical protein
VTTLLMWAMLIAPPVGVAAAAFGAEGANAARLAWLAALGWLAMAAAFWPTVRFYRLAPAWALALPAAGALFLAMTWSSAFGYWRGTRATWKNRSYDTGNDRSS